MLRAEYEYDIEVDSNELRTGESTHRLVLDNLGTVPHLWMYGSSWETRWTAVDCGLRRGDMNARTWKTGHELGFQGRALMDAGRFVLIAVAVVCSGSTVGAGDAPRHLKSPLDAPIILAQLPLGASGPATAREIVAPRPAEFGEKARIVVVKPDGATQILTEGFHSACDPDVSFDAHKILFSGKRAADDLWNIYEMQTDGSKVRQITDGLGNCRSPCYQSTLYTIISPQPWYQLTFVSDAAGTMNEDGSSVATHLYSAKLDGTSVRRLTYNLSSDFDPLLMWDGRLLYSSWRRGSLEHGLAGSVDLSGVNLDGADNARFAEDSGRRVQRMPCVTTSGLVVFVESDRFTWDGAGQLAAVPLRRPLVGYRQLKVSEPGQFQYHSPSPFGGGQILVSRRPTDGSDSHGVYRWDPASGATTPVFDDPGFHDIQAKLVRPRIEPDGRSSVVTEEDPHGKLFCLNVNLTDAQPSGLMPAGVARRLRVLEGVPIRATDSDVYLPTLESLPAVVHGATVRGIPPLAARRILGEVDLADDGSFNIQVPANTSIELQTLDADGMALQSCNWVWAKNHEPRGCIGCHEDGELTPENMFVEALQRPSLSLCPPPERRRTVEFLRDVMPIIQNRCVPCHDADGATPRLDGGTELVEESNGRSYFNRAYRNLLRTRKNEGDESFAGLYVHPGRARTSPLVWHVFGRNTSRSWDTQFVNGAAKRIPTDNGEPISEAERKTLIEWIDTGALWTGANDTHN